MAQDLGGMGWVLIGAAAFVLLQKKGVAQGAVTVGPPTTQQLAQAALLPTSPVSGSDSYTAWLQSSLNQLIGAGLSVDGVLGPLTRAAVMQFQTIWGIAQTGIVDPETDYDIRAALGQAPYIDQPYSASGGSASYGGATGSWS